MNYNDGKKTRSSNTGAEHTAKRATFEGKVSVPPEFQLLDRYWKASNYLSVGQIYLLDKNPLLRRKLELDDLKPRLLGHFGTTPGQNFIYCHLNKLICERKLNVIYISGPGQGGPAVVSQVYLEGTYTDYYPTITEDLEGMGKLFKQFSFPGGIPSHVAPETPGSMHEGGELGYSLSHAFGAVLDKPDLIVACVVGDGEAETGPLATSWHSNKFLNPQTDGCVLPILHLNGYKIDNPTVLDRIPRNELIALFVGYGYEPMIVEGSDPGLMHPAFYKALSKCADKIKAIKEHAKQYPSQDVQRPTWPMIILRSPKGWTGPKEIDGLKIEGSYRSHQVPMANPKDNPKYLEKLEDWLMSYDPESIFNEDGQILPELKSLVPPKELRMGNNPYTNPHYKPLLLPDYADFGIEDPERGTVMSSDATHLGYFLKRVIELNAKSRNFRIFGPDETKSNRLGAVFDVTTKQFLGERREGDDRMSSDGRVMEMLSEHQCEGWLEGYVLTGGHGLINSYEAFIHIITSMFNQHCKWMKMCQEISWRNNLPSLNILLSSHVWRQDHNGFTHQDPGFLGHVVSKKPTIIRIYLPPDANCLLSTFHHCLSTEHKINVVVCGKHEAPQWLSLQEAHTHCATGIGIWPWASNDKGREPDIIMASAGDVPTLEALAATSILRKKLPRLIIRFVNVVNLMKLCPRSAHPHGLSDNHFDSIFTTKKPVIFAFHGVPHLVEKLVYKRRGRNFYVKGYEEQGSISTAFDMTVMNKMDRFHLVIDVCNKIEHQLFDKLSNETKYAAVYLRQEMESMLLMHKKNIDTNGVDMEEISGWKWDIEDSEKK